MIAFGNCPHPESWWKGGISIQELGSDVGFVSSCTNDHLLLAQCVGPVLLHPSSNEVSMSNKG